jgi:hypothetical protein
VVTVLYLWRVGVVRLFNCKSAGSFLVVRVNGMHSSHHHHVTNQAAKAFKHCSHSMLVLCAPVRLGEIMKSVGGADI